LEQMLADIRCAEGTAELPTRRLTNAPGRTGLCDRAVSRFDGVGILVNNTRQCNHARGIDWTSAPLQAK
jgi:hypothetical protein